MNLDKFYTKDSTVELCLSALDVDNYDLIIEPSAGDGAFSDKLDCIAYDLAPENDNIIQQDWFTVGPQEGRVLVVGNPPFGSRSTLAKNFIKHSIKIGASTIAFILPEIFSKLSNQSLTVFPSDWRLTGVVDLPRNSFTADGKNYGVPCKFYIWTKEPGITNMREVKRPQHPDFTFLPRGSKDADFCVNGNNGKVKNIEEITNPKSEHYIKANINADQLRDKFKNMQYTFLSSVNGGNAWIGQQDILKTYGGDINGNT